MVQEADANAALKAWLARESTGRLSRRGFSLIVWDAGAVVHHRGAGEDEGH